MSVEAPDTSAKIDFLGGYPVTVNVTLEDGDRADGWRELRVEVISASQYDAPILLDVVVEVPPREEEV